MKLKSLKFWILLSAVGVILSGCGGDDSSTEPTPADSTADSASSEPQSTTEEEISDLEPGESMTLAQMQARVYAEVDSYSWPLNYYPDLDTHFSVYAPNWENTGFQPGYHETFLGIAQTCAWAEAWLDARSTGDNEEEQKALSELETISTDSVLSESPSTREYLQTMVGLAELGDPTQIQRWADANCRPGYWTNVTHSGPVVDIRGSLLWIVMSTAT